MSPALAAPAMALPRLRPRPSRGFLRFFAVSCITTAWLTLVLFVIFGIMSFGAGSTLKAYLGALSSYAPSVGSPSMGAPGMDPSLTDPYGTSPQPGLGGGMGTGGMGGGGMGGPGAMAALAGPMVDRIAWLFWLGGFLNILSGVMGWIFFVGLGKLTYGFLDLEEQASRDHDALQVMVAAGQR